MVTFRRSNSFYNAIHSSSPFSHLNPSLPPWNHTARVCVREGFLSKSVESKIEGVERSQNSLWFVLVYDSGKPLWLLHQCETNQPYSLFLSDGLAVLSQELFFIHFLFYASIIASFISHTMNLQMPPWFLRCPSPSLWHILNLRFMDV